MFIKFADGIVNTSHVLVVVRIDSEKFCICLRLSSDDNLVESYDKEEERNNRFDKLFKQLINLK